MSSATSSSTPGNTPASATGMPTRPREDAPAAANSSPKRSTARTNGGWVPTRTGARTASAPARAEATLRLTMTTCPTSPTPWERCASPPMPSRIMMPRSRRRSRISPRVVKRRRVARTTRSSVMTSSAVSSTARGAPRRDEDQTSSSRRSLNTSPWSNALTASGPPEASAAASLPFLATQREDTVYSGARSARIAGDRPEPSGASAKSATPAASRETVAPWSCPSASRCLDPRRRGAVPSLAVATPVAARAARAAFPGTRSARTLRPSTATARPTSRGTSAAATKPSSPIRPIPGRTTTSLGRQHRPMVPAASLAPALPSRPSRAVTGTTAPDVPPASAATDAYPSLTSTTSVTVTPSRLGPAS
mmetsp:Transcript_30271/g.88544  ORF Transcript_30271/g.88544 Transcript_30271/m.88544 type:complete len:364 (+) Transcript_30271:201-1292(+)